MPVEALETAPDESLSGSLPSLGLDIAACVANPATAHALVPTDQLATGVSAATMAFANR